MLFRAAILGTGVEGLPVFTGAAVQVPHDSAVAHGKLTGDLLRSGEARIADLGVEPREFAAGGLERAIRLQRLPETMTKRHLSLKRRIKVREKGDTRLFIRVQQEDGHRAWTSPIYLFR